MQIPSHPLAFLSVLMLGLSCAAGCIPAETTEGAYANSKPIAALRAPVIAAVGASVMLDASLSFDPDADPLTFIFDVLGYSAPGYTGQSIETNSAELVYAFPAEGIYTIRVNVRDLHGDIAVATQDVTVRAEYPDPPDFCRVAPDCSVGDECSGGVCYSNGGGID